MKQNLGLKELQGSPLLATAPVVRQPGPAPVIVVGLPRSGSTLLAGLLSHISDWYVFDDLYLYRKARSLGVKGPLTEAQLEELIFFLGWQLRARIKSKTTTPPRIAFDDVDRMDEALRFTYRHRNVEWHELLEEWMTRLALHHGCSHWGFKTPQDFMHLDVMCRLFPQLRCIFLYRDPRAVMASRKHVSRKSKGGGDGDPRHYHVVIDSIYWKMAVEKMARAAEQMHNRVLDVQFEKLIADPQGELGRCAKFLDSHVVAPMDIDCPNSSFQPGRRMAITPTETYICERIAGQAMCRKGYEPGKGRLRLTDLPDFLKVSMRFVVYQIGRLLTDKAARVSVRSFIRHLRR